MQHEIKTLIYTNVQNLQRNIPKIRNSFYTESIFNMQPGPNACELVPGHLKKVQIVETFHYGIKNGGLKYAALYSSKHILFSLIIFCLLL